MKRVDYRRVRVLLEHEDKRPGVPLMFTELTIGGEIPLQGTQMARMADLKCFLKIVTGKDVKTMVPILVGIPWAASYVKELCS